MDIERDAHGDEAKQDTDRMNFMEAYGGECVCLLGTQFYYRKGFGQPHARASSLRDAIDGAIKLRMSQNGN
jgi:hypothetical protein